MKQHASSPSSMANCPVQPGCVNLMHWLYMCKAEQERLYSVDECKV